MTMFTIAAAASIAIVAALPFALPGKAHVERKTVIPATPDALYRILETPAGFDRFNPFRDADPDLAVRFSGPASGVGAAFSWSGKSGSGAQTIVETAKDCSVVMQLDLGAMGQPRQSFTLRPTASGTEVTWALDAEFGLNPLRRVFGLFMDGMLGPIYERGLKNFARLAAA